MHFVERKSRKQFYRDEFCALAYESQIKNKIVMNCGRAREKKEGIFCAVYFLRREFFEICVLSQGILN